jgi:glycosyltransferase involved in cell wall biosynthesis
MPPQRALSTPAARSLAKLPDIICLSHLRWDFVFQRPQHLLTRFARERRVFYVEEPTFADNVVPRLERRDRGNVQVLVPHLPNGDGIDHDALQRKLIDALLTSQDVTEYVLWYYTPMALAFTEHLAPLSVVYDCMDELSAFKGASTLLSEREAALMQAASLVFTGGHSLYEAKRAQHRNIHPFPSSVDVNHFAQARSIDTDPADQADIPHPRLGFFGVIDERMNIALLREIAEARPDWQLVMLGPVVKIDQAALPMLPNIHYLGSKQYNELPTYIAGWDVALLPFALNEATRFISPTKTPEYMAAGKPVVSTSIRDVVRPYGKQGFVRIADDSASFIQACSDAMAENAADRLARSDVFLRRTSWDSTWQRMRILLDASLTRSDQAEARTLSAAL